MESPSRLARETVTRAEEEYDSRLVTGNENRGYTTRAVHTQVARRRSN